MSGIWSRLASSPVHRTWLEPLLLLRGVLFRGRRHQCPCCGWSLRAFVHRGGSFRRRPDGYCPRCNAKARHRRDWLFLQQRTDLFTRPQRLLHVAPWYSLARLLSKTPTIDYHAIDIQARAYVRTRADVVRLPFRTGTMDAVVCIHVLEHLEDDRAAIRELQRVLRPGGWALVTVPLDLEHPTYEDPSIQSKEDRRIHFGEPGHVRRYGLDLEERLQDAGFAVVVDRASDLDPTMVRRHGLKHDEHVFLCTKPS